MADVATVMTLRVKMRKAAKDYPAFGITKGQQIFKWRAGGKKHISLTDPRAAAPVDVPVEVAKPEAEPVTGPKLVKKRGPRAKAQAPVVTPVTDDLPPE